MPSLNDIPGYREALARERELREAAFLGVVPPIAGVEVVPLTVERLNLLLACHNVFVCGGITSPAHAVQFLWIISPRFRPGDTAARDAFLRDCARLPAEEVYAGIRDYLADALFDIEETRGPQGTEAPIASWIAFTVDAIASEYGWSRREILTTPIVELSQYLRVIEKRRGGTVLNPTSNKVLMRHLEKLNRPKAPN